MYRYFEITGQNAVVAFDIEDVSPAALAPAEEFEKEYKMQLREIGKKEYSQLKQKYSKL